jgi:glycolate oxidase FAD binding subunit
LPDEAANHLMSAAMALPAAVSAAAHVPLPRAVTALRLEGFGPSVEARSRDLKRALEPMGAGTTIEADESRAFWHGVRSLDALPRQGHVLWRLSVPPARGWRVQPLLAWSGARYVYDWAGGLVWAAVPEDAAPARTEHVQAERVRAAARSLGGHAALIRAPAAMREALSRAAHAALPGAADPLGGMRALHARLKAAFDPCGILNPGLDLAAEL